MTREGVALGERLFFDPILSIDSTVACGSCHDPAFSFSDPKAFSDGVAGKTGRNSMAVVNVAWMPTLFWDGRAGSVEEQALGPVENPVEMGESWPHVVEKLQRHPDYPRLFDEAFETSAITPELVVKAIAQYERTLISANARYDRFKAGEETLTAQEELGRTIFFGERGDCFHCHGTALFTDNRYHNNGLDAVPADSGLAGITGASFDLAKFKTPSLRNVAVTAPYMHDGRFETLEDVVTFYNAEVQPSATLDPLLGRTRREPLSDEEQAALVAFLHTLTDDDFLSP
ncbi:MAG: cytochrome c peroxidase [Rhodothermales bacterium]